MTSARTESTMVVVTALLLVSLAAGARGQTAKSGEQKSGAVDPRMGTARRETQPPVSLRVTLSVYSGRPNPAWTLEPGPELDRLTALIKDLKPSDATLFDYDEWNRLGYASFWLSARGLPGVPEQLHIWRDMAFVPSKEGKGRQAVGASKLYEALVSQAESRGHGSFFLNYRKLPPPKQRPPGKG